MALNFSDGTYEVRLFKKGKEFTRATVPQFFRSIASVRAKVAGGMSGEVQIELTPSLEDGLALLQSGLLGGFAEPDAEPQPAGATAGITSTSIGAPAAPAGSGGQGPSTAPSALPFVAVRFLYPSQTDASGEPLTTPWFTGFVATPDLSFDGNTISITLRANGTSLLLNSLEGPLVFGNQSALAVLQELVSSLGYEIQFGEKDTSTKGILEAAKISGAYNEPRMTTLQRILKELNCTYSFNDGSEAQPKKVLLVKSNTTIGQEQPEYTFVLWRQIDPDNKIIPMLTYSMESQGSLFVSGGAFGSQRAELDLSKKKFSTKTVGQDAIEGQALSSSKTQSGAAPMADGTAQEVGGGAGFQTLKTTDTGQSVPVTVKKDVDNKQAEASVSRANTNYINVKFSVPGLPKISVPGVSQIIIGDNIPGLSNPISVQGAEHICDENGWITEIDANQWGSVTGAAKVNEAALQSTPPSKGTEKQSVSL